jgi:DNA-binding transcriptional regulator YiaG
MITADQIRAARALLRLDQRELAQRAHVSLATLRRVMGWTPPDGICVPR